MDMNTNGCLLLVEAILDQSRLDDGRFPGAFAEAALEWGPWSGLSDEELDTAIASRRTRRGRSENGRENSGKNSLPL